VIVVDTSAIIAIWQEEPGWELLLDRVHREPDDGRSMSVASFIEAGTVMAGRRLADPASALDELDKLLTRMRLQLIAVDEEQARLGLRARIRYGRGFGHAAKLNYGDCFSYALAKTLTAPLLYVGDDFDRTDVRSALRKRKKKK
jgi:ribonuclease VapC